MCVVCVCVRARVCVWLTLLLGDALIHFVFLFSRRGVHFPKVEGVRFLGLMRNEKSSCGRWGNSAFIFIHIFNHHSTLVRKN